MAMVARMVSMAKVAKVEKVVRVGAAYLRAATMAKVMSLPSLSWVGRMTKDTRMAMVTSKEGGQG